MSTNTKVTAGIVALFVAAMVAVIVIGGTGSDGGGDGDAAQAAATPARGADAPKVLREDTRILGEPGSSGVVLTEFLDLECEACRAAFPLVEELREEYAGRVTFAFRYFPLPSHFNAMNAAVAVEAAGQQGQHEAMYKRMYETQSEWGEGRTSEVDRFRGFADAIGLDMAEYDRAVADPETQARVERDRAEGEALGVGGTPTFFLNASMLQPTSGDDLRGQIDAALAAAAG